MDVYKGGLQSLALSGRVKRGDAMKKEKIPISSGRCGDLGFRNLET
jgi:hypothetical protein